MKVLVDTSVWSLALRRTLPRQSAIERELSELVREGRAVMVGAIRQELLAGVRVEAQFAKLRDRLRAFDDLALAHVDFEEAAACSNKCRARGVQGGSVDFLLCAIALRRTFSIFSSDSDFDHFATVLPLKRHHVRHEFADL